MPSSEEVTPGQSQSRHRNTTYNPTDSTAISPVATSAPHGCCTPGYGTFLPW